MLATISVLGETRTGCDLCRNRAIALHVKMRCFLPQQAIQKSLSQGICCSGSCDAYAQGCHVTDDKAADEKIHEVEDEVVDIVLKLLRVALAAGIIVKRTCG